MADETYLIHDEEDNVATALADLTVGTIFAGDGALIEDIPYGHKFALLDIDRGGPIRKYGVAIGRASRPIRRGAHVHVHNVEEIVGEVREELRRRFQDEATYGSAESCEEAAR